MSDNDPAVEQLVADRLAELTLDVPASDRDAIAGDYVAHLAMDASLDELIGAGDTGDPQVFDPMDPR